MRIILNFRPIILSEKIQNTQTSLQGSLSVNPKHIILLMILIEISWKLYKHKKYTSKQTTSQQSLAKQPHSKLSMENKKDNIHHYSRNADTTFPRVKSAEAKIMMQQTVNE